MKYPRTAYFFAFITGEGTYQIRRKRSKRERNEKGEQGENKKNKKERPPGKRHYLRCSVD
jgi:hypothetical protein